MSNKHFRYIYLSISDIDYVSWLHYEKLQQRLINEGRFTGKQVLDDPKTRVSEQLIGHRKETLLSREHLTDGIRVEVKDENLPENHIISI